MAFICVSLVEPLHQAVMGRILALEYMLSGACGHKRLCPIMLGTECRHFLRPLVLVMPIYC
jgi:hypothetical protein